MNEFELDERLRNDSLAVTTLALCDVRLMNDSRYRWLLLIPRRPGISEWHELSREDAAVLTDEIHAASAVLKKRTGADKINVAAIGNMVRQMHVHVVARHKGDETWPGTVWNSGQAVVYDDETAISLCKELSEDLAPGV